MYFYMLCLFGVSLISSALCGNLTSPETNHTGNHTSDGYKIDMFNKTKLTLVSEGGTLLPNTLSKQKLNSLITLDEELSKTKEKAVVPRKGVNNMLADITTDEKISLQPKSNKTEQTLTELLNTTKNPLTALDKSPNITITSALSNTTTTLAPLNSTIHHKKPLILSAEALASWEKKLQDEKPKIPSISSTETMASSQIPSPNKESIVKVYPIKANNSHPGMIMPIVITILVVPMFAIVGYMALKRGKEAWKNRHYKRMDFLLDGMYND